MLFNCKNFKEKGRSEHGLSPTGTLVSDWAQHELKSKYKQTQSVAVGTQPAGADMKLGEGWTGSLV